MTISLENDADHPIDALSSALDAIRAVRGRFYASRVPLPWGLRFEPAGGCVFHLLRRGRGTLWVGDAEVPLREGELILLPHGDAHALGERPDGWLAQFPEAASVRRDWAPGAAEAAEIICGEVVLREGSALPLLGALPPILRVPGEGSVSGLLDLLLLEADSARPGAWAMVARLAELLVVHAVRDWAARAPEAPGWVRGARDPHIGRALAAIQADPAAPWSVEALARLAGSSRSRFSERFTALLGVSPAAWVSRVRMGAAARELASGEARVSEVAERSGYESAAAFSRAFKRVMGFPPRAARTRPDRPHSGA